MKNPKGLIRAAAIILPLILFILLYSASLFARGYSSDAQEKKPTKTIILYGQASYYAVKFEGRHTASGERFIHTQYTAACNMLPLGTWIRVTNLKNGKIIVVKVNDRLHAKTRRLVDLTKAGAQKLGFIKAGLTRVKVEVIYLKAQR